MSSLQKIIPYILYGLLLLWSLNDIFFWDTVQLASKHGHFFFENNLMFSFLPDDINSGHIPAFGYYLALVWSIFGKTLVVSHLAMLPFVMGIVYFSQKLVSLSFSGPLFLLSLLVVLSDPTLVAQIGLVSPDVPLICFFLAAFYYQKQGKVVLKALSLLALVLMSMRGMFLVFAFFLFEWGIQRQSLRKLIRVYAPAVLIAGLYFVLHYFSKGWFAFHSDSPWGESFSFDSVQDMLKKPIIIFWRLIDFNRWILFLVGGFFAYRLFKADRKLYMITSDLYLLGIITVIFGLTGVLFSGLTAHRYFLPMSIMFAFYFLRMVHVAEIKLRTKKIILISTCLVLWAGHLLIYPAQIDQGWDASLAHKPYFTLRSQAVNYLSENNIGHDQVCTAFPDLAQGKYYSLGNDESTFQRTDKLTCDYILISNIHNEIEPADFNNYELVKEWKSFRVWYRLLRITQ